MGRDHVPMERGGFVINISLSGLITFCFLLGLAFLSVSWMVSTVRVRRREVQRRKGVILCRICGVRYEGGNEDMTLCPACETPNESRPPDLI